MTKRTYGYAHIWLQKYGYAPMATHLWLRTYDYAPTTTHLWLCTYMHIWLNAPMATHLWLRTYDYAPMATHLWLRTNSYAPMATHLWPNAPTTTHLWLCTYMATKVWLRTYGYAPKLKTTHLWSPWPPWKPQAWDSSDLRWSSAPLNVRPRSPPQNCWVHNPAALLRVLGVYVCVFMCACVWMYVLHELRTKASQIMGARV
jgi:hypothetical protein